MGQRGLRRPGAVIATVALTAGLAVAAFAVASEDGPPAPVVWRDHVVETTTTTAP